MDKSEGQILIEVLVGAVMILLVVIAVSRVFQASSAAIRGTAEKTAAVFLGQEVAEAVRAVVAEDWQNLGSLATSTNNKHHTKKNGAWSVATSTENVELNSITYSRYFYLSDVYRLETNRNISEAGDYYDPSTLKVTVVVDWTDARGASHNLRKSFFVSRHLNEVFPQADWSGGAVGDAVTTVATTTFATSTNIDSSAMGTIKLAPQ